MTTQINDGFNIITTDDSHTICGYIKIERHIDLNVLFCDMATVCMWSLMCRKSNNNIVTDDSVFSVLLSNTIGNRAPIASGDRNKEYRKRYSLIFKFLNKNEKYTPNNKITHDDLEECTDNYISLLRPLVRNSMDPYTLSLLTTKDDPEGGNRCIPIADALKKMTPIVKELLNDMPTIKEKMMTPFKDKILLKNEEESKNRMGVFGNEEMFELVAYVHACDSLVNISQNSTNKKYLYRFGTNSVVYLFYRMLSISYPVKLNRSDSVDPVLTLDVEKENLPDLLIFTKTGDDIISQIKAVGIDINSKKTDKNYTRVYASWNDMDFVIHLVSIFEGEDVILKMLNEPKQDFITTIDTRDNSSRTIKHLIEILDYSKSIPATAKSLYSFTFGDRMLGLDNVPADVRYIIHELIFSSVYPVKGLYNILYQMDLSDTQAEVAQTLMNKCQRYIRTFSEFTD